MRRIPEQGPDPYNAWKDCESQMEEMRIATAIGARRVMKLQKVADAAAALIEALDGEEIVAHTAEFDMLKEALEEAQKGK